MAEYITKEQVVEWFRPYGHIDEPIPYETLVDAIEAMSTADTTPKAGCEICQKIRENDLLIDTEGVWYGTFSSEEERCEKRFRFCPWCGTRITSEAEDEV